MLEIEGLRPTGDRLRETLFNWLQTQIAGKNILDLCAGAGALGFEAASRGAQAVTLVEKNKQVAAQLVKIQEDFGFHNTNIICRSAQNFLQTTSARFDVIFIDPPFAINLLDELTELSIRVVNTSGFIYREAAKSQIFTDLGDNWNLYRQKTQGQVKIQLWQNQTISEEF